MGKDIVKDSIFGDYKILVRDYSHPTKGAAYQKCECIKCKRIKSIRADSIRKNPHCRCEQSSKLINQIVNNYKVLEITNKNEKDGSIILKCQCIKCGFVLELPSNVLRSDKHHCPQCYNRKTTLMDMTGQTFGFLTVLERDLTQNHIGHSNDSYWICKCNRCGTIKSIRGFSLRNGLTKSCGCIKSQGEETISKILNEHNISFKREYSFPDLVYKLPLKFDFAIFKEDGSLSHLIEYDGEQHFYPCGFGGDPEQNFKLVQLRDNIKNNYCQENNIKLIRIKFNEEITFERIMNYGFN